MKEISSLKWDGKVFEILDQRRLPKEKHWEKCTDHHHVIGHIKTLAVRGAPAIGIAGAYALVLAWKNGLRGEDFAKAANEVRSARPTAINLMNAVDRILSIGGESAEETARKIWEEDLKASQEMADFGLKIFPSGGAMTICHTGGVATGGGGTALAVLDAAYRAGKMQELFVLETRPLGQGLRLTAWEAHEREIPLKVITDGMIASVLSKGWVKSIWVGADRIAGNGDTANKIGTYSAAVIAKHFRIPLFVVAPSTTFDSEIDFGHQIPVEERLPNEILKPYGVDFGYPDKIQVFNPAFDVTPSSLITAIVSEKGIWEPNRRS